MGASSRVPRLSLGRTLAAIVAVAALSVGPSACGSDSDSSNDSSKKGSTGAATSVTKKEAGAPSDMQLTFSDEFDGPKGDPPDPQKWTPKIGPLDSNQELQYYTDHKNAELDGNGNLVITARKESTPLAGTSCLVSKRGSEKGECVWTSARLSTKNKSGGYLFSQAGGRFEARVKLPEGQGVVPAFWLLGANQKKWPEQGEIDIFEAIGEKSKTYAFIKSLGWFPGAKAEDMAAVWGKKNYTDEFHTFTFDQDVDKGTLTWSIDGEQVWQKKRDEAPTDEAKAIFDQPWYVILNMAVGGSWPGDPRPDSVFPKTMTVDYVRAYKKG
jgi:beta-glucanase (GH16 family)